VHLSPPHFSFFFPHVLRCSPQIFPTLSPVYLRSCFSSPPFPVPRFFGPFETGRSPSLPLPPLRRSRPTLSRVCRIAFLHLRLTFAQQPPATAVSFGEFPSLSLFFREIETHNTSLLVSFSPGGCSTSFRRHFCAFSSRNLCLGC